MLVMEVAEVGNTVDTGLSNLMLTASPMTADAALEPIRRENRVPPIQWPVPRNHGKQT
jgi:hypothetical protein